MPSATGRGLDAIAEMLGQVEPTRFLRVKFHPRVGAVCQCRDSVWSEGLNVQANTEVGTAVCNLRRALGIRSHPLSRKP